MSNPFVMPGSPIAELERKRRERFKVGVYAALCGLAAFLCGMLIQGCNREQPRGEGLGGYAADSTTTLTNAVLAAEQRPQTNPPASTNIEAVQTPPLAEPAASVAGTPPPVVTNELPAVVKPSVRQTATVYVVKSGDTLLRIAKTHATTVQAIKAANGLKSDRILVGKELKIPQAKMPLVSAARS